jgi:hypothetical protein
LIFLGNFTDKPNSLPNNDIIVFLCDSPQISSFSLSIFEDTNETKSQPPTFTSININPQQPSSLSKAVVVGVSIGSVSVVLIIYSALSITYKRAKKNKMRLGVPNDPNSFNGVQINDDNECTNSEYQQQHTQDPQDPPTTLTG